MDTIYQLIALRLKEIRSGKSLSLETVGNAINIHRETVRRYEKNPKSMDVETLVKMLNFYGVKLDVFFTEIYGKLP